MGLTYDTGVKKKLTLEHRIKISKAMKGGNRTSWSVGHIPWNKGLNKKTNTGKTHFKKGNKGFWLGKKRPDISGENNPNYGKFGVSHPKYKEIKKRPFYKAIRETYKYKEWRKNIFLRDNFSCVLCGERGGELNADHFPKRFIDIMDEHNVNTIDDTFKIIDLWNIHNGRTLCKKCHLLTPTWGRRIKSKRQNKNGLI